MNEKILEQLLQLSLINIENKQEKKNMLVNLEKTLDYFSSLKEIETANIKPSFSGHSEDLINKLDKKEERGNSDFFLNNNLKKGEYLKGPKIL